MRRVIALIDSIIGVAAICAAFAVAAFLENSGNLTRVLSIELAIVAALGIATLIASYGLASVQPYGLSYQAISAIGWIVASCVVVAKEWGQSDLRIALYVVVPLSLVSLASLAALGDDTTQTTGHSTLPARLLLGADAAVIALFFAFIYPEFKALSSRIEQTQTMATIRTIAAALEKFAADHKSYPEAASIGELQPFLQPAYIRTMPRADAWRNDLRYEAWRDAGDPGSGAQHYAIGSAGKDRLFELPTLRRYQIRPSESFASDIVFRDGAFIAYPNLEYNPRKAVSTAEAFKKGTELYHNGKAAEAIPLLEDVVRADPGNALAQARLGGAYCNEDRFPEAIPHLQRASTLDPTDYQSRSNLGIAYQRLGQPELGIAPAREAVALQPTNPVVLTNLGWVLLQAKKYDDAIDAYTKAVRLSPNDAQTHYYLALAYLGAGKRNLAQAEEQTLRKLDAATAAQLAAELKK